MSSILDKKKLNSISEQIDKLQDKMNDINEEVVDIVENVELSDDEEKKLEKLKNLSGVEIDNVSEYDIIQGLVDQFKPRELAKPLMELSEGSEDFIIENVRLFLDNKDIFSDPSERELFLKSCYESYDSVRKQFKIKEIAEKHLGILSNTPLNILNPHFVHIIASKRGSKTPIIKFNRQELELFLQIMTLCSAKKSTDEYIEENARSIELFAIKDKKIKELYSTIDKKKVNSLIIDKLIGALKEEVDINKAPEFSIYSDCARKSAVLTMVSDICLNYKDEENDGLQIEINKMGERFKFQQETFDIIINFKYLEPFRSYNDHVLKVENNKGIKQQLKLIEKFMKKLVSYPFNIPIPHIEGDVSEVKNSNQYLNTLVKYYDQVLSNNGLIFGSEERGNKDFGAAILLIMARYDKKYLEHINLKESMNEIFRFYTIMETLAKIDQDKFYTRDLVNKVNEIVLK